MAQTLEALGNPSQEDLIGQQVYQKVNNQDLEAGKYYILLSGVHMAKVKVTANHPADEMVDLIIYKEKELGQNIWKNTAHENPNNPVVETYDYFEEGQDFYKPLIVAGGKRRRSASRKSRKSRKNRRSSSRKNRK